MNKYNKEFFKFYDDDVVNSANLVVPLLLKIISPKSVIDFGCGIGTWLGVFKKHGIKQVLGIDGEWVDDSILHIEKNEFEKNDLSNQIRLNKKYDLAISLEVGEHLKSEFSENLVSSLTNSSDIILFSAAVPFQGGTRHLNEQWQSFWKNLFEKKDFVAIDYIRPLVWDNPKVKWWYAQNTLLYVRKEIILKNKNLSNIYKNSQNLPINLVHPRLYEKFSNYKTMSLSRTFIRIINSVIYKISV